MRRWLQCAVVAFIFCAWAAGVMAAGAPRIVSLGPAITEQVGLLGMESNLVGVTTYCELPPEFDAVARIGTVTGLSAESIVGLQPDLVLATGLTPGRDLAALERVGLKVVRFTYARQFEEICAQFLELGELLDRRADAQALIDDARRRLAAETAPLASLAKPTVFVEIGAHPLFTANRDSFIHDMIERAGGINLAADAASGLYSREQVLASNPDVILIVTMGVAAEEERALWMATPALRAAATGRIHVLDAYTVCSPTPLRFVEATAAMAKLLHPEI